MSICENCQGEHAGSYGSGRFCSSKCARGFSTKEKRKEINEKVSKTLTKEKKKEPKKEKPKTKQLLCCDCNKNYVEVRWNVKKVRCSECKKIKCLICGDIFEGRKDKTLLCKKCRRNVKHSQKNNENLKLLDVSTRTISKILKRANKGCSICNWNESTCDIHHIIERKNGGTDENDNLIVVCPNCHRIIHTTKKYSLDFLKERNIDKVFSNWKEFYHICN